MSRDDATTEIFDELLARNLLTRDDVLFGDLTFQWMNRKNQNIKITRKDSGGFFVKLPIENNVAHALHYEAAFYMFLHNQAALKRVQNLLPVLELYDREANRLVLELVQPANHLWEVYQRTEQQHLSSDLPSKLGVALAALHKEFYGLIKNPSLSWMRHDQPWVFQVHKPAPEALATLSPATHEILSIIQRRTTMMNGLDGLAKLWSPQTIIHGDLKSENIIVHGGVKEEKLTIIDWELVQFGDPAWDVGSIFHDFLQLTINSPNPAAINAKMSVRSEYRLIDAQKALRRFLRTYLANVQSDWGSDFVLRAVKYAAARLVQSAFELSHFVEEIPSRGTLLLQLAQIILEDPEEHQVRTFGVFE